MRFIPFLLRNGMRFQLLSPNALTQKYPKLSVALNSNHSLGVQPPAPEFSTCSLIGQIKIYAYPK